VPLLSAAESLKTFKLPPGFRIEVVASDPLVEHPVAMAFDGDGRMWVCEMRGYMPDPEGKGEEAPIGRISILTDTDDDGTMDKSRIFLDELVLPRAVQPFRDGALVAVPPLLLFCRDTDGDGRADERTTVVSDYGVRGNPEHMPNGAMPAMDNWIYSANYGQRIRYNEGRWVTEVHPEFGQWGISQDDFGRLFFNTNSSQLRGNLVPPQYVDRNPHHRGAGVNVSIATDQTVWPAHPTAVNRGYVERVLRDDGTLSRFTGACGPVIYRGHLFPPDFYGNAFVCEVTANLIRRNALTEENGAVTGENPHEKDEFLTSTYERFRPVNLANGPDGALYVVDMHHGLIQHKQYLTPYLKKQYLARELEKYLGRGRIYRIALDGGVRPAKPKLQTAPTAELVALLSHANGWWRDTAQRLLVERADRASVAPLKKLAAAPDNHLARLHALWTLEGMRRLEWPQISTALNDPHPKVRAAAIRLTEPLLASPRRAEVLPKLLALIGDTDPDVRLQFTLSLSDVGTPEGLNAIARVLHESGDNEYVRDAAITGMRGRELEFLERLLTDAQWAEFSESHQAVFVALAECVLAEANPKRVGRLLDVIAETEPEQAWRQLALLDGFPDPEQRGERRRNTPRRRSVILDEEPQAIALLEKSTDPQVIAKLPRVVAMIHWPGQPGYTPPPPPIPLTSIEQERYENGRAVYNAVCIQCHKIDGMGQEGLAPPLVDSEWAVGAEEHMARIVLNGMRGPVTVNGRSWNLDMPSLRVLSDEQIAAALTYVRRSWGHTASPVAPQFVAKVRAETETRKDAWTEKELLKLK
jgi:mono/diheme cytochrome c family protein/glucose/arabinose dehydrogenase